LPKFALENETGIDRLLIAGLVAGLPIRSERNLEMRKTMAIAIALITLTGMGAPTASTLPAPIATNVSGPTVKWGACPPIFPGACQMTVLQGDPAKPNSDVVLKVGPGNTLPRHKHTSAERMILLTGKLQVKYDGAEAVTLNPSNYAYGPAGLPHVATCKSKVACTLFIAFEGPVDAELVTGGDHQH
jgi:quercetin dioxygenase-like cupin family protein